MSLSTKTGKAAIQAWCQEITGENIPDFTYSFENGVLFLKIIHYYRPDLVDLNKIYPSNKSENLDLAFDLAFEQLKIDTILTSKDFDLSDTKKMKDIYKFIGQLFKHFCPNHEIFAKRGTKLGDRLKKSRDDAAEEDGEEVNTSSSHNLNDSSLSIKATDEDHLGKSPRQTSPDKPVLSSPQKEEICEECELRPASKFCGECETKQCDDCAEKLHQVKKRKNHLVVPLAQQEVALEKVMTQRRATIIFEKGGMCDTHPEERIVAYCKTCDAALCTICMLKSHDNHVKQDLSTAKPENLMEFENLLKEYKLTEQSFREAQKALTDNYLAAKDEIQSYFKRIHEVLQAKEKSIFEKLDGLHEVNDHKLSDEIKKQEQRISKMENETNFVEQLKLKIDGKHEMKKLKEDKQTLISDGYLFDSNTTILTLAEKLDCKASDKTLSLALLKATPNLIKKFQPHNTAIMALLRPSKKQLLLLRPQI